MAPRNRYKTAETQPKRHRLRNRPELLTTGSRSQRKEDNEKQTIEQMIEEGYLAIAPGDPATSIVSDKTRTSWQGLDDVIHQIRVHPGNPRPYPHR